MICKIMNNIKLYGKKYFLHNNFFSNTMFMSKLSKREGDLCKL